MDLGLTFVSTAKAESKGHNVFDNGRRDAERKTCRVMSNFERLSNKKG